MTVLCGTVDNELDDGVASKTLDKKALSERDICTKFISPVCHVAFDKPLLTRKERVKKVREKNYFTKYGEAARAVLDALLDKYADEGVDDIEDIQMLKVRPLTGLGTPTEIIQRFGGKEAYVKAVRELEDVLYETAS